ncbi:MAG: hypothetical protein KBD31_01610 [Proteobacteria bacterium]|nr:hypothetical protein [Pseudomonadota bacterium]
MEKSYADINESLKPNPLEWAELKQESALLKHYAASLKKKTRKKRLSFLKFSHVFDLPNATILQKIAIHDKLVPLDWYERKQIKILLSPLIKTMNGNDVDVVLSILNLPKDKRNNQLSKILSILNIKNCINSKNKRNIKRFIDPFLSHSTSCFDENYLYAIFSKLNIPEREKLVEMMLSFELNDQKGGISYLVEHILNLTNKDKKTLQTHCEKVFKSIKSHDNRILFLKNILSIEPFLWRYYSFRSCVDFSKIDDEKMISTILKKSVSDIERIIL